MSIAKQLGLICLATITLSAQAHAECKDYSVIQKAAEGAYSKKETPHAGDVTFDGTTKTGKDKWEVQMNINEECLSTAIIYTKQGSCEVINAISLGLGEGACG